MTYKYIATPISVSIHLEGESPIYGRSATRIFIEDESGGPFLRLEQDGDNLKGELKFDEGEFQLVYKEALKLLKQQPKQS